LGLGQFTALALAIQHSSSFMSCFHLQHETKTKRTGGRFRGPRKTNCCWDKSSSVLTHKEKTNHALIRAVRAEAETHK
jgi:hypothetical protein